MSGDDARTRLARTEALFRDVNERIAETIARFDGDEASLVCECADADCTDRFSVPLEDYERVREDAARFVVAPGHNATQIEAVVDVRDGFNVVEKVDRVARETVVRLDPRTA